MKINNILSLATAAALTFASSGAFAVATIGAGTNSGAAGATVTIPVTYNRPAGDANNVFSATFRFAHTNPPITFVSFSSVGATPPASSATTCNANGPNTLVTCVLTTNPPTGGQCVTIDPTQDFSAYDVLPAFDLWNFTTSWKGIMGSNFDANFWIKNLTDKKYKTYGSNQMLQFGYATYVFGHPREIGLNVRYNF